MKWEYSSYSLSPSHPKNSRDDKLLSEGYLLRVQEQGHYGYSDYHPQPVFGDLDFLSAVERQSPHFLQSLAFAQKDARARALGKSLRRSDRLTCHQIYSESLRADRPVKLKVGRDLNKDIERIEGLSLSHKLRLDFNASLGLKTYNDFVSHLSGPARAAIEFVEDPIVFEGDNWEKLSRELPLALDNEEVCFDWQTIESPFQYLIIKPAKQKPEALIRECEKRNIKFVFTHYMDHIVGVRHAQAVASEYLDHPLCADFHGLSPADWQWGGFAKEEWTEVGIGLSKELEGLTWQKR